MRDLIQHKRKFWGKRVKEVREKLGMNHAAFAKGCGLSAGTVVTIEAGDKGYIIDSLVSITIFIAIEFEDFVSPSFTLPSRDEIVSRMESFHVQHKSRAHLEVNKKQRLSNVLKERLLASDFLLQPRTVGEIIDFCKVEFGVELISSSVSNAMKRLKVQRLVTITRPPKGRHKLYQKSKRRR